jgi:predicted dehydrogenase
MNTPSLKIGLIGCGTISNAYFEGLRPFRNVEVVAAADLVFERAEAKAREHGVRAATIEGLLGDPAIDLVINLTIPRAHASVNTAILEAGKHAYVEKPLALDLAEGRAVLALAQSKKLRVGCAPDTFLGGAIQTARQVLDQGEIGAPIGAVANMASHGPESWHPDPAFLYQAGAGPMLDMGPYYITALVNLLGPIRRVTGSARASYAERIVGSGAKQGERFAVETPTHYAGVFDFANGAIGSLNMSFDVWSHTLPFIEIYGTEGTLRVPDPNFFDGTVELRRSDEKEWRAVPLTHSDEVRRGIGAAEMARAIQKERPHRASGELACHVLEAMLAVELASSRGAHVLLETTVERPQPLPPGLPVGELDADAA